jgi:hypothetical protein
MSKAMTKNMNDEKKWGMLGMVMGRNKDDKKI